MTVNWSDLAREEGFYDKKGPPSIVKKVVPRKDAKKAKPETIKFSEDFERLWSGPTEFRRIPSFRDYYISKDGVVKNIDGQTLRRKVTSSDSQISLRVGVKNKNFYKFPLIHEAWPELAPNYHEGYFTFENDAWKIIPEFPEYAISFSGKVLRLKNFTYLTEKQGRVYMSKDKRQISRAVRRLCFETFLHDRNELKYMKEYPGFAISSKGRIWNLRKMTEIQQYDSKAYTTFCGEKIYFPVKALFRKYFVG